MSDNFKIFFYPRKNYVNKNGEVSIRVFLVLNGERAPFTSEITTPMELWDDEENCASGDSKQALAINEELDDLRADTCDNCLNLPIIFIFNHGAIYYRIADCPLPPFYTVVFKILINLFQRK